MYSDIFTNKWVLGGVGFLIVLSVACVLWYEHDIADEKKAAAEAEELLRQSEKLKKVFQTDNNAEQATDVTPAESNTPPAEKQRTDTTQANETTNTDNSVIAGTTEPIRMSPNGFGAVPEMPEGAPFAAFDETMSSQQELLYRVLVKLWNDGDTDISGGFYDAEQGKVYPYYPNVIYVLYETQFNEITGQDETMIAQAGSSYNNAAAVETVMSGDIPSGYTLVDKKEAGINPYEYLDLPNK